MHTDTFGIPVYSEQDLIELLYQGHSLSPEQVFADLSQQNIDCIHNHTSARVFKHHELDISVEEFDTILQQDWLIPDEYKNMNIEAFLVQVCPVENYQRLVEELKEYQDRNMIDLLKWVKYFVDTCNNNNILIGVGRGSSVSSYVLYLLGLHKIDSIKYQLDWQDFFR